jgi:hypothetical protein
MKNEVNAQTNILTWAIALVGYELQAFTEKYPKLKRWRLFLKAIFRNIFSY